MAPLFAHLNGTQRHPYCRPIGGPVGFDPRRQRINHTAFVVCAVGDTHHHGTRRKAQVRLASAGSLLTAVALELVAGKTWAAGLTRTLGAELDRYSTTRSIQLEESPAAFGRRGRLGCPPARAGCSGPEGEATGRGLDPHLVTRARRSADRIGQGGVRARNLGRGPQTAPWRNRDGEILPGERITPEARAAGWQDTVAHPVAAHVRPRH